MRTYAKQYGIKVYDVYIDDGISGTVLKRPAFERMKQDIIDGKINMVLMKDTSRMYRNMEGSSEFEDNFCKAHNVTICYNGQAPGKSAEESFLEKRMKRMFDEYHPCDISAKVKATKNLNAKQGKFNGSIPAFGYKKVDGDIHRLTPSEDAVYVKEIFERVAAGHTPREICDDFNRRGIRTPGQLASKEYREGRDTGKAWMWEVATIYSMLRNPVYLGHMVQGKRRNQSYKSKVRVVVSPEDYIVKENQHEAIIPVELWNAARQAREKCGRNAAKVGRRNGISKFAGIVFCADCMHTLTVTHKEYKTTSYDKLRCSTYTGKGRYACTSHEIRTDVLEAVLLQDIHYYAELADKDKNKLINRIVGSLEGQRTKSEAELRSIISAETKKLDKVRLLIKGLYEEKTLGSMPPDTYNELMNGYVASKVDIEAKLRDCNHTLQAADECARSASVWVEAVKDALEINGLSREMLLHLIEKIVVHERCKIDGTWHQDIDVYYRFVGRLNLKE